ncbi:MAG: AAA family ATPase [Thermovirgaceae bacterium]|nr:AAA family ATPase [Thermovirgaceae bacterium]
MLSELIVTNVGGIRDASLHFRGKFIAITGESGAGKSSLVRALELASGKRAQSSLIRAGVEEAEVQAVLEMDGPMPSLPEDLQPQEGFIVVKRIVSSGGRAKTYLQDRPVPLNTLNTALSNIIAIQSQFAQLELLDTGQQVELLDNSGGPGLRDIKTSLSQTVSLALEKERKLLEMTRRRREIETRHQEGESFLAKYSTLNLKPGCETEWETEMNRVSASLKRQKKIRSIYDRLTGGSAGEGLSSAIELLCGEIRQSLGDGSEPDGMIEKLLGSIQELEVSLKKQFSRESEQELNDAFDTLESRLGALRKLMRFAKVDNVEDLMDYAERTQSDLEWLRESRVALAELQDESSSLKKEVSCLALSLRESRRSAAVKLEEAVNGTLSNLAMEGLRFGISIAPLEKVRHGGADDISFFLTDGKHLKGPVSKIASGGELSRILLSLQIASSDDMLPDVLVFDEVEAGLGGRAAVLAGYALKELSLRCQVILITHEASIAALADQHFKVEREGDISRVLEVDLDQRVGEISRMLAGNPRDPEAIGLARSLLENQ